MRRMIAHSHSIRPRGGGFCFFLVVVALTGGCHALEISAAAKTKSSGSSSNGLMATTTLQDWWLSSWFPRLEEYESVSSPSMTTTTRTNSAVNDFSSWCTARVRVEQETTSDNDDDDDKQKTTTTTTTTSWRIQHVLTDRSLLRRSLDPFKRRRRRRNLHLDKEEEEAMDDSLPPGQYRLEVMSKPGSAVATTTTTRQHHHLTTVRVFVGDRHVGDLDNTHHPTADDETENALLPAAMSFEVFPDDCDTSLVDDDGHDFSSTSMSSTSSSSSSLRSLQQRRSADNNNSNNNNNEVPVKIVIHPDEFPQETSWTLFRSTMMSDESWMPVLTGTDQSSGMFIEPGRYAFELRDALGDGMNCCDWSSTGDTTMNSYRGSFRVDVNGATTYAGDGTFFGTSTGLLMFDVQDDGTVTIPDTTVRPHPTAVQYPWKLYIIPDHFPHETHWTLHHRNTTHDNHALTLLTEGDYQSTSLMLPPGRYVFELRDHMGDGFCCDYGEGSFEVSVDGQRLFTGSNYLATTGPLEFEIFDDGTVVDRSSRIYVHANQQTAPTVAPTTTTLVVEQAVETYDNPTIAPTVSPTAEATLQTVTGAPTEEPTDTPTRRPSVKSNESVRQTTGDPTMDPSINPTMSPTIGPTMSPTSAPSAKPTTRIHPTTTPTVAHVPSAPPTVEPTVSPTMNPTVGPSDRPIDSPTENPTETPTITPTQRPTTVPTVGPTLIPTVGPTLIPTVGPTAVELNVEQQAFAGAAKTEAPTMGPTTAPSTRPPSHAWIQLGMDLDGQAAGDESGRSIALSADGSILAIGAAGNDNDSGNNAGHVRVFQYSNLEWTQLGDDLLGGAASDVFGIAVALSANGRILAVGAPGADGDRWDKGHVRVFTYDDSTSSWGALGSPLVGPESFDYSGRSVALSGDGSVVAVGTPSHDGINGIDSGHVRIYRYEAADEDWQSMGQELFGEGDGDDFGWSVALSENGLTVAMGAKLNDGRYTNEDAEDHPRDFGHVRVFTYQGWPRNEWTQKGQDLDGDDAGDNAGWSVALSADGNTVALGAIWKDIDRGEKQNAGHVRVFEYNGFFSRWSQLGQDLEGLAAYDEFGHSVALSANGRTVAIGGYLHDPKTANGTSQPDAGHVRVFQYQPWFLAWRPLLIGENNVEATIPGEAAFDNAGFSVALSADGSIVAMGAMMNDGNGSNAGHVRVFELPDE